MENPSEDLRKALDTYGEPSCTVQAHHCKEMDYGIEVSPVCAITKGILNEYRPVLTMLLGFLVCI